MPVDIINGLTCMPMEPHTDREWVMYPHVILTGPKWDPTVLDNKISDKEGWYNNIKELNDGFIQTPFDEFCSLVFTDTFNPLIMSGYFQR